MRMHLSLPLSLPSAARCCPVLPACACAHLVISHLAVLDVLRLHVIPLYLHPQEWGCTTRRARCAGRAGADWFTEGTGRRWEEVEGGGGGGAEEEVVEG